VHPSDNDSPVIEIDGISAPVLDINGDPEINYDQVDQIRGMDIVTCTTANTDEEAKELLTGFNLPFRK